MLSDFFRINMPYGVAKNDDGEWMAFNREYMPLGHNNEKNKGLPGSDYLDQPIYTKYKRLTNKKLEQIAGTEDSVRRDEKGNIHTIWLYNDGTNPLNQSKDNLKIWSDYFSKVKELSKLQI